MRSLDSNIESSLYYFIRDDILIRSGWYNNEEDKEISSENNLVYYIGNENLIYRTPSGMTTTIYDEVVVKRNGSIVDSSEYTIDYVSGRLVFFVAQGDTDVITVTYSYLLICVEDEYMRLFEEGYQIKTPLIAIQIKSTSGEPLELGTTTEVGQKTMYLYIYAQNKTQRVDIPSSIDRAFRKSCPIYDFTDGFPLGFNGTKNDGFSFGSPLGFIRFADVSWQKVDRLNTTESEKYESQLNAIVEYID